MSGAAVLWTVLGNVQNLPLWEINVYVSIAEFSAQTLSLAYLNGEFVR